MGRQIVHDDNVAGAQVGTKDLLKLGDEGFTVDVAVQDHRAYYTIKPQACNEGCCFPLSVRNANVEPLAFTNASARSCHAG
jgi:hypothetical protein